MWQQKASYRQVMEQLETPAPVAEYLVHLAALAKSRQEALEGRDG